MTHQRIIDLILDLENEGLAYRAIWNALLRDGYSFIIAAAGSTIRRLRAEGILFDVDVAHETIVRLSRRFSRNGSDDLVFGKFHRERGRLAPFLAMALKRELKRTAVRMLEEAERSNGPADPFIVASVLTDHRWSPRELGRLVAAINDLPDAERMVAALIYLDGATPERVMAELGIRRTTYYVLRARANELLEAELKGEG